MAHSAQTGKVNDCPVRQPTVGNGMANAMKTKLLLLAIIYLLGTSSFAASNPFDDASAAYERGDYVQGMQLFRQLAAQGHQWAQRRLGLIYAEGRGVPQDYQEAVKWFRLAAAQGNVLAQYSLGLAYEKGQGVPQDYQEAVKWYRIAAARQDEWAQTRLGSIYAEGKSVPQDFQEAVKWYRLAAAQGYAPAQSSLGLAYEKGQGVPQDYQEAAKWYRLAAAQGNQIAQINLGMMHTNGTGVRQDFAASPYVVYPRCRSIERRCSRYGDKESRWNCRKNDSRADCERPGDGTALSGV